MKSVVLFRYLGFSGRYCGETSVSLVVFQVHVRLQLKIDPIAKQFSFSVWKKQTGMFSGDSKFESFVSPCHGNKYEYFANTGKAHLKLPFSKCFDNLRQTYGLQNMDIAIKYHQLLDEIDVIVTNIPLIKQVHGRLKKEGNTSLCPVSKRNDAKLENAKEL